MPRAKKFGPAELLTLLAEHAPALRRAGVRSFEIDGFTAHLSPPDLDPAPKAAAEPQNNDPLSDPDTYGHTGRVPGFLLDDDSDSFD